MKSKSIALLAMVAAGLQACSAEEGIARRGEGGSSVAAHPTDAEHPGWQLHPGALLVEREDPSAIYDVRVLPTEMRLPTKGHEALQALIIANETILVGRSNEDDPEKNQGFIRGVLATKVDGTDLVVTTSTLTPLDIIRGHVDLGGSDRPRFLLPGARAKHAGEGTKPLARGDRLPGSVTATLLDVKDVNVALPVFALEPIKFPFGDAKSKTTIDIKGSMSASLKTSLFLEVGLSGAIDFGLRTDPCDWLWLPNPLGCTNPHVRGSASLSASYEFEVQPTVELNGSASQTIDLPGVSLSASCVLPAGIPCFVEGGIGGKLSASVSGSVKFTTDRPFRMYGVSSFGGTFNDGDLRIDPIKGPSFDPLPTKLVPVAPAEAYSLSGPAPCLLCQSRIETVVDASVSYGPFLRFGIGTPDAANVHASASLQYKMGAQASVCYNAGSSAIQGSQMEAGGSLKKGPELSVSLGLDAGPFHPSVSQPIVSDYKPFASFGSPTCGGAAPISSK